MRPETLKAVKDAGADLVRIIEGLQNLLVFYRIGKRPTEKALDAVENITERVVAARAALALLDAEEGDGWVSVESELPELSERVLLWQPGFTVTVGHWDGQRWDDDNWNRAAERSAFTHWRPLPRPPESRPQPEGGKA